MRAALSEYAIFTLLKTELLFFPYFLDKNYYAIHVLGLMRETRIGFAANNNQKQKHTRHVSRLEFVSEHER